MCHVMILADRVDICAPSSTGAAREVALGPGVVAVLPPVLDQLPRVAQADEPLPVQALVAEATIEAFDEGVLDLLSAGDQPM